MSVLNKISFYQNQRDEVPNQLLAKALAETRNQAGIQEIATNLWNKNPNIQSDCLKVLYEIGYLAPELIAEHVNDFLKLLKSKNNRLVWGGMIALGTIAPLKSGEIWAQIDDVIQVIERGSVITVVWGVKTLAGVAAANGTYRQRIFPTLMHILETCIPRDVPTHAENMLGAVDGAHRTEFLSLLQARQPELSPAQLTRLKKVIKKLK